MSTSACSKKKRSHEPNNVKCRIIRHGGTRFAACLWTCGNCFNFNNGNNQMKLATLHDLYVDELKDLYNAEHQLLKALPKMAKAASDPSLAKAFTNHLEETKAQIERLEKIFEKLDSSPKGKTCKAMKGLLEEGKDVMADDADPMVMDAALIASAQRVEHYEMAGYGCVRTYARLLGYDQAADLLQQTLDEEGAADKQLTKLAETVINAEAVAPAAST